MYAHMYVYVNLLTLLWIRIFIYTNRDRYCNDIRNNIFVDISASIINDIFIDTCAYLSLYKYLFITLFGQIITTFIDTVIDINTNNDIIIVKYLLKSFICS